MDLDKNLYILVVLFRHIAVPPPFTVSKGCTRSAFICFVVFETAFSLKFLSFNKHFENL